MMDLHAIQTAYGGQRHLARTNKEPFMSAGKEKRKRKKKPSTAAPANRRDEWTDTMLYHFYASLLRNWLC